MKLLTGNHMQRAGVVSILERHSGLIYMTTIRKDRLDQLRAWGNKLAQRRYHLGVIEAEDVRAYTVKCLRIASMLPTASHR